MSNVPAARQILRDVAKQLRQGNITKGAASAAIAKTLPMLTRQRPVRRAPRVKRYVTRRLISEIKAFARQHPEMHLSDIATHFGVNPGRVSEVLNGKR